ncbi:hypothetical protein SmJEL517_g01017 [Synchytrium microbalum]|uniref:MI domain-containing protein n=1 Tax=Synchytrium microbalum TaxID=1806994 RepID=A0A507C6B4_9FUNG|nr:uncharacterized protein SmJEL517_g01017 [Synchytrium microbalum]TPX37130.1 hypothetical protein SmJEL517_g01017 [Synchytrium microbalum]
MDSDDEDIGPRPPPAAVETSSSTTMTAPAAPKETRAGGAYIPPARLRQMQASITDKSSPEYQRMTWDLLKKSINGLVNKVNMTNFKNLVPELFNENLLRGQGLLCRSLMKAQAASLQFTPVFAAMAAIVNTKIPSVGELLISRLVIQFRRAFKRGDKPVCLATSKFISHLVNQKVADDMLILELLSTLLERPTDDSVELAVGIVREVGAHLMDYNPKALNFIMDSLKKVLNEGDIDKRTQYIIEVVFVVRKEKFKDNEAIPSELDLVEEDDQITHQIELDDTTLDAKEIINVFSYDKDYVKHEAEYAEFRKEVLGDDDDEEGEAGEGGATAPDQDDSDEEHEGQETNALMAAQHKLLIQDQTNTNLINLRRGIYLTIMSSLSFEECTHKLMKLGIEEGQEIELANMIIECCSQERTYLSFYGLMGERFCKIGRVWAETFASCFEETFKTIHRFETNRIRNIGKYFAHLLASDALTWNVFALIKLTEQDTTSASRIFIKIIFQELVEALGLKRLNSRLKDPMLVIQVPTAHGPIIRGVCDGLFPRDNPRNTRFAINYFTSIGMGGLTEELREHLKNAPKQIMAQQRAAEASDSDSSDSDSDSESSSSSSSSSSSEDESPPPSKKARVNGRDSRKDDRNDTRGSGRRETNDKRTRNDSSRDPPLKRDGGEYNGNSASKRDEHGRGDDYSRDSRRDPPTRDNRRDEYDNRDRDEPYRRPVNDDIRNGRDDRDSYRNSNRDYDDRSRNYERRGGDDRSKEDKRRRPDSSDDDDGPSRGRRGGGGESPRDKRPRRE